MKARTILCALAATMMLFVACDKDDDNGNTNGGGITPTGDNYAIVGTLSSTLETTLEFDDYGTANFGGTYMSEAEGKHVHFGAGIAWESLGKSIDLAGARLGEEYWFRYEGSAGGNMVMFTQRNTDGYIYSDLNHEEGVEQAVFTSGTLTTEHVDGGYTLAINGTLTDGTTVEIRMKVAYTDEVVPLTKNSLIYDGVKYEFTTTAQRNGGTGNVTWSSTGANGISSAGTVYQGSNNLHIFLQDNPIGDDYYFDFSVDAPGIQLDYSWHDDQLTGTLNGEAFTSTPFTEGDAEISAYSDQLRVTVIGTLASGKVLKLYVDSPY